MRVHCFFFCFEFILIPLSKDRILVHAARPHCHSKKTTSVVPFLRKMSHPKRGNSPIVWYCCQTLTDSCQNFVLS